MATDARARALAARAGAATLLAVVLLALPVSAQQPDSLPPDSTARPIACTACISGPQPAAVAMAARAQQDTGRPRAIVYSDAYGTRLAIHRIASYAELPLFVTEYFIGQKVLNDEQANPGIRSSLRGTHSLVATGLEALFAVNTVTGVWNLIEARHDPSGRARRWIHGLTMLAADAGFVATASSAHSARGGGTSANTHRALAIGSMSLATASTLMMWLWKD